jgi:hypothetical protein
MALRRAVALTGQGRGVQVSNSLRTEVMLDLADWYLLLDLQPAAKRTYAALWSVLAPVERQAVFAGPVQLYIPHPGNSQPSSSVAYATEGVGEAGIIEFEIDVGPRGRVIGRPRKTQVSPANLAGIKYHRAAGYAIFRPLLVEGVPVRSDNVRLAYGFEIKTPGN